MASGDGKGSRFAWEKGVKESDGRSCGLSAYLTDERGVQGALL